MQINELCIITITRNRPELLKRVIENCRETVSIPYKHIIVNDASDMEERIDTELVALSHSNIQYIRNEYPMGVSRRYNIGLRCAYDQGYQYIAMTHDDVVFSKGWVENILTVMDHDYRVLVANPSFTIDQSGDPSVLEKWIEKRKIDCIVEHPDYYFNKGFIDYCVFKRSCLEVIGFYDERYSTGSGDSDYYYRLLLARRPQATVFGASVFHQCSAGITGKEEEKYKRRLLVSAIQMRQKWRDVPIDYDAPYVITKSGVNAEWPVKLPWNETDKH